MLRRVVIDGHRLLSTLDLMLKLIVFRGDMLLQFLSPTHLLPPFDRLLPLHLGSLLEIAGK